LITPSCFPSDQLISTVLRVDILITHA